MVVTAASSNHFGELRGMVHSMQSKYPDARFVVYDLGLTNEQRDDVRRWCNARYVSFDPGRYPPHVKNLLTYAWKPLIIAVSRLFIFGCMKKPFRNS
ncbi:hypothetical protein AAVH_10870 [Aphelenchoides avenae]|nr:hypothetical protein AAVH_10870 [Aphelenchus avenae]